MAVSTAADQSGPLPSYCLYEGDDGAVANAIQSRLKLELYRITPSSSEILACLRLLRAFCDLKESISNQDGLFGIYDEDIEPDIELDSSPNPALEIEMKARLKAKRWQIYITRAVDRFTIWWHKIREQVLQKRTIAAYGHNTNRMKSISFEKIIDHGYKGVLYPHLSPRDLPPIDVLLIWYTFMTNSWAYLEDCVRQNMTDFWCTKMPWELINAAIDSNYVYRPSLVTEENFVTATKLYWHNVSGPDCLSRSCPSSKCQKPNIMPYSTVDRAKILQWAQNAYQTATVRDIPNLPEGAGLADKSFSLVCTHCGVFIDHEYLKAAKFYEDMKHAIVHQPQDGTARPMRGTILDQNGRLRAYVKSWDLRMYPTTLITYAYRKEDLGNATAVEGQAGIAEKLTRLSKDPAVYASVSSMHAASSRKKEGSLVEMYVDRMIARYCNFSRFGVDLVAAVLEQGPFIDKMREFDWINSPSARPLAEHIQKRYRRFFDMLDTYPDSQDASVPTLDIHLAWYTHQLSPSQYYSYSLSKGRTHFRQHASFQRPGLGHTRKRWTKLYNEPFDICLCWYCSEERFSAKSGRQDGPEFHLNPFLFDS